MPQFQFDSFQAFIAMGGHGPYVWAAYGVGFVMLLAMVISPIRKKRLLIQQYRMNLQRSASQINTPGNSEAG